MMGGGIQDVIVDAKSNAIPIASKKRFEVFLSVIGFIHLVRMQMFQYFDPPSYMLFK